MEGLSSKLSHFGGTESVAALLRAQIPLQPLSWGPGGAWAVFPLCLPLSWAYGIHFTLQKGQFSPCPAACGTRADVPISLCPEVVFPPRLRHSSDSLIPSMPLPLDPHFPLSMGLDQ